MGDFKTVRNNSILLAGLIFGVVFLPLSYSHATEDLLCISVFVCDEQTGEILPQYNDPTSPCYSEWEAQCASYAANMMQVELTVCHDRVDAVRSRVRAARQRNRIMQQRIQRLRSRVRQLRSR